MSTLTDEEMRYCYSIIMLDSLFDMMYMSMTRHMYVRQSICMYDWTYVCMIGMRVNPNDNS